MIYSNVTKEFKWDELEEHTLRIKKMVDEGDLGDGRKIITSLFVGFDVETGVCYILDENHQIIGEKK